MIAQKYRLSFHKQTGLSPAVNSALGRQLSNADEMFETLFTEARRLATLTEGGVGGSRPATGYWTVLTDGDLTDPQLIFAGGDAIAVFVPTP